MEDLQAAAEAVVAETVTGGETDPAPVTVATLVPAVTVLEVALAVRAQGRHVPSLMTEAPAVTKMEEVPADLDPALKQGPLTLFMDDLQNLNPINLTSSVLANPLT
uniref:Uncharacterized protein n=1 Tax=Cacopsylla melanoneura TaxID=428564 RepID=A0A8D8QYD2_9HEMI